MPRFRWIVLIPLLVAAADAVPGDDPFPIARVRVAEADLAEAVKPFDPGILVRIPRDEFEASVRAATERAQKAQTVPRLIESRYTATLAGGELTGTVEWVIHNPRAGGAALPLDPLRIALQGATWSDGKAAVVGAVGGGSAAGPGVWIPGAGRHVLKATWAATGTGVVGDRQFDLRLPPAPVASLDLDLPTDRMPVATTADILITGPFPASSGDSRRSWRLRFGDRPRVEFAVRGAGAAATTGTVLASLSAQYDLTPGQTGCVFEYDLRPAHGPVGAWAFTLSPGLLVTDVVANNRADWRVEPTTRELRVNLRQPGAGGKIQITAIAPLPQGKTTSLPIARPVGALVGDERVEVKVGPELELEAWAAGDYRLTDSTVGPDRGRVMALSGTLLPAGATEPFRRLPSVRVAGVGTEFSTTEAVEWRVEGGRPRLVARVAVRVTRGPLFQIIFRPPPGFTLERVTGAPDDVVAAEPPRRRDAGADVDVDFLRPVPAGQGVELRLSFRAPVLPLTGPVRLAFPHLTPLGAATRDGWVSLSPGPGWSIAPRLSTGVAELTEPKTAEPPPPADAAMTYHYRGREPEGELVLSPIRPTYSATTQTRTATRDGRVWTVTRIGLRVTAGEVPAVMVFEPGPPTSGRTWAVLDGPNAVTRAAPVGLGGLPGLAPLLARPSGGLAPVIAAATSTKMEPGTYWVVRFARPITTTVVLESAATLPVSERPPGEGLANASARLIVCGATAAPAPLTPMSQNEPSSAEASPTAPPIWSFDRLHLVTTCSGEKIPVVFGGTILSRGGPTLVVRLPPGAAVQQACVGGYWLDSGQCQTEPGEDGPELRLPIPTEPGPMRFEVRYLLPGPVGGVVHSVTSSVPVLPAPVEIPRWWVFPPEARALWPFRATSSATELPPLLGAPPDGKPEVGFSGPTVIVISTRVATAAGVALAALLALIGWIGVRRASRWVGAALAAVIAAAGALVLLGPSGWALAAVPIVATGLVGLAAVIVMRGRASRAGWQRPAWTAQGVVGALVLGGVSSLLWAPARAEPPPREVVFILPGPADNPTRETVLAPRSLLDRLDTHGRQAGPGTVIVSARYDGRLEDGLARFVAHFQVHSYRDGEAQVSLPLADVRLEQVTVAGKLAHPVAIRPDVYTVTLPGRGLHEVEARFAIPVGPGPERDVRFGVPEVPDSRLVFAAPAAARQLQAVGRLGDQKVIPGSPFVRLEAAIGGVRVAQVRWRQGPVGAAVMTVREGCVWDLSEGVAGLTACYNIRIDSGTAANFRFDLPADLEPVRVIVRPLDPPIGPGVRDWVLGSERDGLRSLRVDLTGPADGRVLVVLECSPRSALTRHPTLRFPRPVGMERKGGVYGLRTSKLAVEKTESSGVTLFAADALAREFGGVQELRLGPAGHDVTAFSPRPGEVAELRPLLRVGPEPPTAIQDLTWRVGPRRADGEGQIRWVAKEPLTVLEFRVPPLTQLLEVRSPEVADWAQTDGRVVVWFRKPLKEGLVEWFASYSPTPAGKSLPDPLPFDPPVPQLVDIKATIRSLRVFPVDGWAVTVDRDQGWARLPPSAERVWEFRSDTGAQPLRLRLFPPLSVSVRGFGLIAVTGSEITYRVTLECPLPPNRPHHLVVHVSGAPPGAAVTLDLPPGTEGHDRSKTGPGREWDLDIPASPADRFRGAVMIRFPMGGTVPLPVVGCDTGGSIPNPAGVIRWVGITGHPTGMTLTGALPTTSADQPVLLADWTGEVDRLERTGGVAWAVQGVAPTLVSVSAEGSRPSPTPPPRTNIPNPGSSPGVPASDVVMMPAVAWCLTVAVIGVLFALFPRTTWPEQVGLVGALFGVAIAGGPLVGVAVTLIARTGWLLDRARWWR